MPQPNDRSFPSSRRAGRLFALALACLPLCAATATAAETTTTTYGMSVIGLPIGRASFDTVIDGNRFQVNGSLASAGLGSLVSDTGGTSRVTGRIASDRLYADTYGLNYHSDDKSYASKVDFNGGRVTKSAVSPNRAKQKPSYVPVERSQLSSVVDPLSGLMLKTSDPDAVCRRTLPFFDGWSRLDLKMTSGGSRDYSMDGYSGKAEVCNVRIDPIGGYDKKSKGLAYLKNQTIQIWFAPISRKDLFVPVYARIPTQIGPLTLSATSVSRR